MTKATVSAAGLVSIPEEILERLNLKPGTEVTMEVVDQTLVVKPLVRALPDWRTMQGMSKGSESLTKALEDDRAAENAHYEARIKDH
jgi:AbrB family looped-hinge helix DNA binding protein